MPRIGPSRRLGPSRLAAAVFPLLAALALPAPASGSGQPVKYPTSYRSVQVDGLSIFYREAGPKDAPALLLLHGLPTSSRQFEPLFERLSDGYRLVAPDYPGFGHSDWPDPKKFAYTFDHIAEVMNRFTETLGLSKYTLYMHDYGGPVGFRMALAHPDRVEALIVQDAVAHDEVVGAVDREPAIVAVVDARADHGTAAHRVAAQVIVDRVTAQRAFLAEVAELGVADRTGGMPVVHRVTANAGGVGALHHDVP